MTTPAPLPAVVIVFLSVVIVAMIPFSAWGFWHGYSTLQADRRIAAAGLTAEGRITRLVAGRDGSTSASRRDSADEVRYALTSDPGRERRVTVDRALFQTLTVGQIITLMVDPADPDRHVLDRAHEVRGAWVFALGCGALLVLSLGLAVWMLRGGFSPPRRV